jgi:hypothetical protein
MYTTVLDMRDSNTISENSDGLEPLTSSDYPEVDTIYSLLERTKFNVFNIISIDVTSQLDMFLESIIDDIIESLQVNLFYDLFQSINNYRRKHKVNKIKVVIHNTYMLRTGK